jgi:hypothetical protein
MISVSTSLMQSMFEKGMIFRQVCVCVYIYIYIYMYKCINVYFMNVCIDMSDIYV